MSTLPLASKNPLVMRANVARLANGDRASTASTSSMRAAARRPGARCAAARRTGVHFVTTFHNAYGAENAG